MRVLLGLLMGRSASSSPEGTAAMGGLPRAAWGLILTVITVAVVLVSTGSYAHMHWSTLVVLIVLFLICDSAPAQISLDRARVSLSYAAGLASVVLLGPT